MLDAFHKPALCLAMALSFSTPIFAAHPLATEDSGTQGSGNIEFENGFSSTESEDSRTTAYQPQISFGLSPTIDLIIQPSWLSVRAAGVASNRGVGDTNLDAKWRFFGVAPYSLAVRAGLQLPTSQHALGLARGDIAPHATAVATVDLTPFTVHANIGLARIPGNGEDANWARHVSAALMWASSERLTFTAEGSGDSGAGTQGRNWVPTVLLGTIYTVQPGLDLDLGFQSTIHTTLSAREWLIGITYRFAL